MANLSNHSLFWKNFKYYWQRKFLGTLSKSVVLFFVQECNQKVEKIPIMEARQDSPKKRRIRSGKLLGGLATMHLEVQGVVLEDSTAGLGRRRATEIAEAWCKSYRTVLCRAGEKMVSGSTSVRSVDNGIGTGALVAVTRRIAMAAAAIVSAEGRICARQRNCQALEGDVRFA